MVEVCGKNSIILENAMKEGLISLRGAPVKPTSTTASNDKENTAPNSNNVKERAPPTPKPTTRKTNGPPPPSNLNNPNINKNNNSAANSISKATAVDPLDEEDIFFLIDRFELSGYIHYRHFMDFFNKTHQRWLQFTKKYSPLKPELFAPATANG